MKTMTWYDRAPLPLIATLTGTAWGLGVVGVTLAMRSTPRPLAVLLIAALGVVFAIRERTARRQTATFARTFVRHVWIIAGGAAVLAVVVMIART